MNIKLWLDLNILGEFNDESNRELVANSLGVICTEAENTPDVIDKNALRFIRDDTLYEYTFDDTLWDTTIVVIPH
jgi:hypothetical protein